MKHNLDEYQFAPPVLGKRRRSRRGLPSAGGGFYPSHNEKGAFTDLGYGESRRMCCITENRSPDRRCCPAAANVLGKLSHLSDSDYW